MKTIFLFYCHCFLISVSPLKSSGQTVNISNGLNLVAQGNIKLVIDSGELKNEGFFVPGNSQVIFDGHHVSAISGSHPVNFYDLSFRGSGVKANNADVSVISLLSVDGSSVLDADGIANNKSFTLKSSDSITASVDILTTGDIIGNATVERFINTGTGSGQHGKSWQLLATPASGQSCFDAWQEGGSSSAGYGTWITGTGTGFDATTATPSIKVYNETSGGWTAVTNTNHQLQNKLGYFLFIRGDRTATSFNSLPNKTNMRSKGTLFTPSNPPPSVPVMANRFQTFGNPYASRIEFNKVFQLSNGIRDVYYVWDPMLNGNYGLGGYQTLSGIAGYIPTSGGATTYYPAGVSSPFIESGQAVFVQGNATGGSVQFNELCKHSGSRLVARNSIQTGSVLPAQRQFLFCTLFTQTGLPADGNIVAFENGLGNELNSYDAEKLPNPGENFSINRNGKLLAVEAHDQVIGEDTIHFYLQNLKKQPYQFRFAPMHFQGNIQAFFIDRFTNSSIELSLSDSSFLQFSVNADPGSSMPDRFKIVFKQSAVVPVFFTDISAFRNIDKTHTINWDVSNEIDLQAYIVERSNNGSQFNSLGRVQPLFNNGGTGNYHYVDNSPADGVNFYRIKANSNNGLIQYSRIVKITPVNPVTQVVISPNPANGNQIRLDFRNPEKGRYSISILNSMLQTVHKQTIVFDGSDLFKIIRPTSKLSAGVYQLIITKEDQTKTVLQLMIQ